MKYTKLFNSHSEYVAYTASTSFIRPNVSYCILEAEPHCTPPDFCEEGHTYEVIGTPSYPSTVAASATSFELSFTYNDIYTTITCQQTVTSGESAVTIAIEENKTTSARTVSGVYNFHGIEIQYSITQEGKAESPYSEQYLTFDVLTSGDILWTHSGLTTPITISYSKDYGTTWQTVTTSTGGTPISVTAGEKVYFKGTNSRYTEGDKTKFAAFSGGTATYNIEGNVMSLIYGDNFSGQTTLTTAWALANVFNASNVISAENLIMPATTLTDYCYRATLANCIHLTTPPELPATTLSEGCYWYMFDNDVAMTTAPDLPSTTLAVGCYVGMFHKCSGLTTAPDLSATTLPVSAYTSMFDACSHLSYIKCLATNIAATSCTYKWVNSVASSGVFVKDASMSDWTIGMNGIPTGWITENEGLAPPTISCDGEVVTLYCTDPTITIYYRLDNVGNFVEYIHTIEITADTVVSAYAVFDGVTSTTVTETCVYAPVQLVAPTITCDGENVFLACVTQGASIYYRLDGGSYALYSTSIPITADTVVDAYSTIHGRVSSVVTQTCEYNPVHHYENDYLTFRIRSNGKVYLHSNGNVVKSIDYSLNGGAWSTITASDDASTYIDAVSGDTIRFRGENASYSTSKSGYTGFGHGERTPTGQSSYDTDAASFDIEGNIMSLVYGDNFVGQTAMTGTYNFCSIFKKSKCLSAEHLILPATTLTNYCYRAMFSWCTYLTVPPQLPATTLSKGCYWYMFERCDITTAPDLLAETMVQECYGFMFTNCTNLNYIKCMAVNGLSVTSGKTGWVTNVASSGTFVKDTNVSVSTWSRGNNGIPTNWLVYDQEAIATPAISFDGFDTITISCSTANAVIYYELDGSGVPIQYTSAITISADTFIEAFAQLGSDVSQVASQNCIHVSDVPIEAANRDLNSWTYNNQAVTAPYSINQLDGHSASYAKGSFNFETTFGLRQAQPTYLWFQHADQSAAVYIDNTLVEKHWGGYTSFFVDVTNYVHSGTNNVKITLKNNEGDYLAPASADFNFNATLGKVKLFTSPYLPSTNYGYDGFHVTTTSASTGSATINVATTIPTGATVTCTISGTNCSYTATSASTGDEMIFSTTITNPHLWNGTIDPYLYDITLEIADTSSGDLYHRFTRPYGVRFYEYVINQTVNGSTYTGFLLNGQPYLLRGCCMHDDIEGKANALSDADYTQQYNIVSELGLNFLRLAHYPHPRETYDWCDRLGIIVETEGPCVNKLQSTMPADYWTHLTGQYDDMVNQHYNHPCIVFWGLSNEAKVDDASFAKTKIETYTSQIKALDSERLVGLVAHALTDPLSYFGNPTNIDWIGSNLYEGWYQNKTSNNPTSRLNTCITKTITNAGKAYAFSEYGCGATQRCHSETPSATTNTGSGGARHDIEYQMWLHEGHIAAIKNKPEIVFSSQWVLFDFAVASRNEGYTVCLDGENAVIDDSLRRLNDKGLVNRDHVTKKDTFYLYKAWWNPTPFVHICGKDYTKTTSRVIKCYTNQTGTFSLKVNGTTVDTATPTDYILSFTAQNFSSGDVVTVETSGSVTDTFTFD